MKQKYCLNCKQYVKPVKAHKIHGGIVKIPIRFGEEKCPICNGSNFSETAPAPEPVQVKETTVIKEVVMIPCAYCKSLMPQTSTFCPHCGARRKG